MKIIIVGATGTIGKHVTAELSKRHVVIKASVKRGDVIVDITSRSSIEQMFTQVGQFDALVSTVGNVYFGDFNSMGEEDFYLGIRNKMMGQINLVMVGKDFISDNGSFTLTSGILADDPIKDGAAFSMVNGAINGFVTGAAIELKRGVRINAVSPGVVEEAKELFPFFPGHNPVSMERVFRGYVKSVEGKVNGQIIRIF